jgi:hypothetical protein
MPPFDKLRRQVRERREPLSALLSCTSCPSIPVPRSGTRNPERCPWSSIRHPGRAFSWFRFTAPQQRGGSFCQEMSGNIFLLSPRHSGRPHTLSRSSCGNAGRDGGQWGGAGASGGGLTWPVARGGSVQGFPCRHYGRCVLDEHIALRPMPQGAHCPHKAKSIRAERNGRKQKSPDGRPEGRITYLDERPPGRPSSRSLCRKADEISSLKWPDCESRAWRRWDACIRPKAASPPDGATGASRLMRAS